MATPGLQPIDKDGNVAVPVDEDNFTETELKGVFLGHVVFPGVDGGHGKVRLRVRNTREFAVEPHVTVKGDVVGSGEIASSVDAGATMVIGEIEVKGQMDINWKWKEGK